MSKTRSVLFLSLTLTLFWCFVSLVKAGVVSNYNVDENCPNEVITHELRVSECNELPCTFRREKEYTVEMDFSVLRNITEPKIKCSTLYLGQHVEWTDPACDMLGKGSCPMTVGENYTFLWNFKIKYFVPPRSYTLYCSLVHDDGNNMVCYYGTGRVI